MVMDRDSLSAAAFPRVPVVTLFPGSRPSPRGSASGFFQGLAAPCEEPLDECGDGGLRQPLEGDLAVVAAVAHRQA